MAHLESSISPRRADLLARLAAERSFLLQQLEGLDEATLTHDPVFGGWTAAGLLAHLAYWDALTADWLSKLADGRPGDIRAAGIVDGSLDTRNADMQRRFAGLPFAQGVALCQKERRGLLPVSYTHLRAHETVLDIVCPLLLETKQPSYITHRSP